MGKGQSSYNTYLRQETDTEVAAQLAQENRRARLAADRRDRLRYLDEVPALDAMYDRLREGRSPQ